MTELSNSPNGHQPEEEDEPAIGCEYAAAFAAEQRHRKMLAEELTSPLEGTGYDFWAGHHDLARFKAAEADEALRQLVTSYQLLGSDERLHSRQALTMEDLYTLITFSRRNTVRALRAADPKLAEDAVTALALIDSERVDWRDVLVALGLATYALRSLSSDPDSVIAGARAIADPDTGELLHRFIEVSAEDADLAAWGFMRVETSDGIGFVDRGIAEFAPTFDLITAALQIADVIDNGIYRVDTVSAAEELAPVWLPRATPAQADLAIEACLGCVTISARLEPGIHSDSDAQQFSVFLVETPNEAAARRLKDWAAPTDDSTHRAISVQHGPVVCVAISRSFVQGVEPLETSDSLARFLEAFNFVVETLLDDR